MFGECVFQDSWWFWWSRLFHWAWNKGYHRYSYVCFIPWPTTEIDSERCLRTNLYNQRYNFNFPIVSFPFSCCNIPEVIAYGVCICQLHRHSRLFGSYHNFLDRWLRLIRKLLNQGLLVVRLKSSLREMYGGHHDLGNRYGISVSQMLNETSFHVINIYSISGENRAQTCCDTR